MCSRAPSDKLQSGDKQMWLWAPAFGKNAHCQLEKYPPGQGISCTEMRQVCGVTRGTIGWQREDGGWKAKHFLFQTPVTLSAHVLGVICLSVLHWTSKRHYLALFLLYQNAHEVSSTLKHKYFWTTRVTANSCFLWYSQPFLVHEEPLALGGVGHTHPDQLLVLEPSFSVVLGVWLHILPPAHTLSLWNHPDFSKG